MVRKEKLSTKILKLLRIPTWLFFVLLIVFILRIPSFFEPYFYGDEMIYLAIGNALRDGVELYKEIFDHKTPLIYLFCATCRNTILVQGNSYILAPFYGNFVLEINRKTLSKRRSHTKICNTPLLQHSQPFHCGKVSQ